MSELWLWSSFENVEQANECNATTYPLSRIYNHDKWSKTIGTEIVDSIGKWRSQFVWHSHHEFDKWWSQHFQPLLRCHDLWLFYAVYFDIWIETETQSNWLEYIDLNSNRSWLYSCSVHSAHSSNDKILLNDWYLLWRDTNNIQCMSHYTSLINANSIDCKGTTNYHYTVRRSSLKSHIWQIEHILVQEQAKRGTHQHTNTAHAHCCTGQTIIYHTSHSTAHTLNSAHIRMSKARVIHCVHMHIIQRERRQYIPEWNAHQQNVCDKCGTADVSVRAQQPQWIQLA